MEPILRFFIGGAVVSIFAALGSLFKPASFSGLFGAAPSVALATLALTVLKEGPGYAADESLSMTLGAVALGVYSLIVCGLLIRFRFSALKATISCIVIWFLAAFGLWGIFLRR